MASSLDELWPENFEVLQLFNLYLSEAIVNLAPMSDKGVMTLDASWCRLFLEAMDIPKVEWPEMLLKLQTIHHSREEARRRG